MPNYGLVVTPTYNPMSYEQYIQPFKDYAQVYNATVDQIDALEMEANQWEKLADSDIDAPQYQQYKSYADDLRKYANDIATQGLSSRTRAGLSRMRQRYAKEIKPIEEAFNYRQKMAEEQRKLNPKGDMQWDVDFSNVGLGAIMANPNLSYRGRSLDDIEKEAYEQAVSLSSRYLSNPARILAGQYFEQTQGFTAEQAENWWKNASSNNPQAADEAMRFINDIYTQTKNKYNIYGENSPYSLEQEAEADRSVISGILKGLTRKDNFIDNKGYITGSGRGGSGSSSDVNPEYIGYETAVKDKNGRTNYYTVIDNGGTLEYYKINEDGTTSSVKLSPEEIRKFGISGKADSIYGRYYTQPHNTNADLVYVMDRITGMPVSQDGKIVKYDRKTQRWNALTKQVEDLPKESKPGSSTRFKLGTDQILQIEIDDAGNNVGSNIYAKDKGGEFDAGKSATGPVKTISVSELKTLSEKDLDEFKDKDGDTKAQKEAKQKERAAITLAKSVFDSLPDYIKNNPDTYVVTYGRKKNSHNRLVKVRSLSQYNSKGEQIVDDYTEDFDENYVPK